VKPTPAQRRILRLFVAERVLARGFSGLHMRRGPGPVDDGMSMADMEIGLIGGWPNG
jgi:hypothetical protein